MGRLRRDRGAGWAAGLRESVAHWRGSRQKGRAMPEELWAEATALAQVHGVYAVSREVGLSYESLRRRTWQREGTSREAAAVHGGFVEVRAAQILGASVSAGARVEVWDGSGAYLAVRPGEQDNLDVADVVRAFLSRRG